MALKDNLEVLISKQQIAEKVQELGTKIAKDFKGEDLTLVCVLKGSSVFFADLIRAIDLDINIDFIAVSSYGNTMASGGEVRLIKDLDESAKGKNIIIIEDIVDSGFTLNYLVDLLSARGPKSLKICTLLDKPSRRKAEVLPDYVGFQIPDKFVVGYGLDYAEKYRNLSDICVLKN